MFGRGRVLRARGVIEMRGVLGVIAKTKRLERPERARPRKRAIPLPLRRNTRAIARLLRAAVEEGVSVGPKLASALKWRDENEVGIRVSATAPAGLRKNEVQQWRLRLRADLVREFAPAGWSLVRSRAQYLEFRRTGPRRKRAPGRKD